MSKSLMDLSDPDAVLKAGQLFQKWTLNPDSAPRDANGVIDPVAVKKEIEDMGVKFKGTVERVHLHYDNVSDVHLSLPNKDSLEERLEKNKQGDDYQLPEFFKDMANGSSDPKTLETFYENRIGDYVLQRCR